MIAIREANTNTNTIRDTHVAFVGKYVKETIDYYTALYTLLPTIVDQDVDDKTVIAAVEKINTCYRHYKKLLKAVLVPAVEIENKTDIPKLSLSANYLPEALKFKAVQDALKLLAKEYRRILAIDFTRHQQVRIRLYKLWQFLLSPIDFLIPLIFDYEKWFLGLPPAPVSPWGPYQLSMALDLKCCPYCNRQYTFSLVDDGGKKKGRPELDHFLPKATNRLLALSFYNLIPSCQGCNGSSLKGGNPTSYLTHLSPYDTNPKSGLMRFSYIPKTYKAAVGQSQELEIEAKYVGDPTDTILKTKVEGNMNLFGINEIYKNHTDIVQEIVRKRSMSSDRYIEILQNTFSRFNLSTNDAYRLAFGNYYREKDFHRRPLAKLTKDIAIELTTLPDPPTKT